MGAGVTVGAVVGIVVAAGVRAGDTVMVGAGVASEGAGAGADTSG